MPRENPWLPRHLPNTTCTIPISTTRELTVFFHHSKQYQTLAQFDEPYIYICLLTRNS